MESNQRIAQLLADPSASFWIKDAIRALSERDPIDALGDAELLAEVMKERLDGLLALPAPSRSNRPANSSS
jgi:hypothetical protein